MWGSRIPTPLYMKKYIYRLQKASNKRTKGVGYENTTSNV